MTAVFFEDDFAKESREEAEVIPSEGTKDGLSMAYLGRSDSKAKAQREVCVCVSLLVSKGCRWEGMAMRLRVCV